MAPGIESLNRKGDPMIVKGKATRWAAAALAACAIAGVAGCSGYNNARGKGDAPVGTSDDSPAQILNMPDGFGNVAMKCDGHGHRVFVPTHAKTDPPITVVDDASCPGGAGR